MRRFLTAGIATLAVLGGVVLGATLGSPTSAAAQEDSNTNQAPVELQSDRHESLSEILDDLVEEGTLDRQQADAVEEAITSRMRRGPRGPEHGGGHLDDLAAAIGIDAEELRAALGEGQTIAEVAEENGVDRQTVVEAIVAEQEEHIDQAIESGRINEDRATELRAQAAARAEHIVDAQAPLRGGDRGGDGGHRHGELRGMADDTAGSMADSGIS